MCMQRTLETTQSETGFEAEKDISLLGVFGATRWAHENQREQLFMVPHPSVPITAAGLQGEKPLVDRSK